MMNQASVNRLFIYVTINFRILFLLFFCFHRNLKLNPKYFSNSFEINTERQLFPCKTSFETLFFFSNKQNRDSTMKMEDPEYVFSKNIQLVNTFHYLFVEKQYLIAL